MKLPQSTLAMLLFLVISCSNSTSTIVEEGIIPLSKEEKIRKLYTEKIVPLFNDYVDVTIPVNFRIDKTDLSVNAGAAFGYIEISQGLVNFEKEYIQIYVLAHELAHIVTLNQAKRFSLGALIPSGTITNDYKKAEYLADLIAIHLMNIHLNEQVDLVYDNFTLLSNLLGPKSFTHPSNTERIKAMKEYLNSSNDNSLSIFKEFFKKTWNMQ
jgi:Zn-dependent protease with chaperone function